MKQHGHFLSFSLLLFEVRARAVHHRRGGGLEQARGWIYFCSRLLASPFVLISGRSESYSSSLRLRTTSGIWKQMPVSQFPIDLPGRTHHAHEHVRNIHSWWQCLSARDNTLPVWCHWHHATQVTNTSSRWVVGTSKRVCGASRKAPCKARPSCTTAEGRHLRGFSRQIRVSLS